MYQSKKLPVNVVKNDDRESSLCRAKLSMVEIVSEEDGLLYYCVS